MNRRDFLLGSAVAAGSAALPPLPLVEERSAIVRAWDFGRLPPLHVACRCTIISTRIPVVELKSFTMVEQPEWTIKNQK